MRERIEELERMREKVFKEDDKKKDGIIRYEELIEKKKKKEFEKDYGWEGMEEKKV
jgi:hypothetical protein